MGDVKINSFSINADSVLSYMFPLIDSQLEQIAQAGINIMKRYIRYTGQASGIMREDAATQIKEIIHEATRDYVYIQFGFDDTKLGDEQQFVNAMVVLYGNNHSGPLYSKPGGTTWNKHVRYKRASNAKRIFRLPQGFNQTGMSDRIKYVEQELEKLWKDLVVIVNNALGTAVERSLIVS